MQWNWDAGEVERGLYAPDDWIFWLLRFGEQMRKPETKTAQHIKDVLSLEIEIEPEESR